jgi:site-specific recombinase XerD
MLAWGMAVVPVMCVVITLAPSCTGRPDRAAGAYLARIRPRFPQASTHRALWAGLKGRGLGGQAIYDTVAARTRAAFGHVVNPHLFRDCAATTIAIAQPGQIGVARDLLGHASPLHQLRWGNTGPR